MATVGLRRLRRYAAEFVRRVEAGEEIDINVSGRLAARLIPAAPKRGSTGTTSPTTSSDWPTLTGSVTGSCWDVETAERTKMRSPVKRVSAAR